MIIKRLALVLGLSMAAALPAAAQSNNWGNVGEWEISIDPTIDNGCYAIASWTGGTVLRIGRNPQKQNFYFLIGNDKWTSLRPDVDYDIQIQFDRRPIWDVSAKGFQFNPAETVYLHAQSSLMDFISEFQASNGMKVSYNGSEIDNLRLNGSRRAWDEVEKCQRAMANRAPVAPIDPFATDDPFASGGQNKNSTSKHR